MKEISIMVPYAGQRHYFDVVLLAGVNYEAGRSRILVGDVYVFQKGAEIPWLTWETFVHEDAEMYERSDALWHQLCNVAKTESISQIYFWLKCEHRQQKERERREVAKSEPEPSREAGKIFQTPRLSILRIEKAGVRKVAVTRNPLRFPVGGSVRRFGADVRAIPAFRILPPPACLSVRLPAPPASQPKSGPRRKS